MGIRSILVPVTAEPAHLPAIRLAAGLAVRLGARLRALHIRPDPRSSIPFIGEGLTAEVIHDLCQAGEREGKAAAVAARAAFDGVVEEEGLSEAADATGPGFVFEKEVGFFADRLGRLARLSDLTVVPQPGGASSGDSNEFLNEVLFGSGRPLLMAPSELGRTSMENVLVAWNGRAECARAVASALPLLKMAEAVSLLTLGEEDPDGPGLEGLEAYLGTHGIPVESARALPAKGNIAVRIMTEAENLGAGMLVIGAYSHNRWREMVIGGVTRHLIAHAKLPVFMSH